MLTHSFGGIIVILKLYMTLPFTKTEGERSFSVLKRVKNHLRSTMSQERLSSLSVLSIESAISSSLDSTVLINSFASRKARKTFL
jgi:hypothetical protein